MLQFLLPRGLFAGGLLLVGLTGAVLFFPVNLNGRYTCLYHRAFCGGIQRSNYSGDVCEMPDRNQPIGTVSDEGGRVAVTRSQNLDAGSDLVHTYVHHFGFFWWTSLALMFGGLFLLRRARIRGAGPDR